MNVSVEQLITRLRGEGPMAPGALATALGVSPPTMRKLAAAAGSQVVCAGQTRMVRYAATRDVPGVGRQSPFFAVSSGGTVTRLGTLYYLWGHGTLVERQFGGADGRVASLVTAHGGVPWFLDDVRPQGFLGRLFVAEHPALLLPPLGRWGADDTMRALALAGHDLWGNVLVGDPALARYLRDKDTGGEPAWPARRCAALYPGAAMKVLSGEAPGSSAGGEQPKFTATLAIRGVTRAVLVKFSPTMRTPAGRRWADLLACEHLALECLRGAGLPAAVSQVFDSEDRRFLEVTRFDREGGGGRCSVVSLGAADAEFVGRGQGWVEVATALAASEHLPVEDVRRVAQLEAFGRLIANTDRHLGNITLFWAAQRDTFALAPIYDMLPMAFAPTTSGELITREPPRALPDAGTLGVWPEMKELAERYWSTVAASPLVSRAFKKESLVAARAAMR